MCQQIEWGEQKLAKDIESRIELRCFQLMLGGLVARCLPHVPRFNQQTGVILHFIRR